MEVPKAGASVYVGHIVFLIKTYVVTPHKNQLNKMVLLRDLSIDFC